MQIDNIKETNFTKGVNNLPLTSDDNVINKLDGFHDDTRMLGIELTLKALNYNKQNSNPVLYSSGSVPNVQNQYQTVFTFNLSPEISKKWLIIARFYISDSISNAILIARGYENDRWEQGFVRYNGYNGGGAVYATMYHNLTSPISFSLQQRSNVADSFNHRCYAWAIPL